MSHLLASINPQAVDRIEERPLPEVGDWILYYPRMGERRRGRVKVPALVVHRDESNRRLDLAIFHEATDVLDQQNVPERVGEDRGWLRKETAPASSPIGTAAPQVDLSAMRAVVDDIERDIIGIKDQQAKLSAAIFGPHEQPKESVLEMLGILDNAIDEIEAKFTAAQTAAVTPAPVTFKRRGRPPKNPPQVA